MKFLDTSIYVAATQPTHLSHAACLALLERLILAREPMGCGIHSMSELYSVLTRMPPPVRISPAASLALVQRVSSFTKFYSLTTNEQMDVIRDVAERHLVSGIVHDAALLACARKAGADTIYTLNARHFKMAAPDLAGIIREP